MSALIDARAEPLLSLLVAVAVERARQQSLHPEDGDHDLFVLLSVLGEEVGEVHQAALELRHDALAAAHLAAELRAELIQVAAVALKIVELADAGRAVIHHHPPPADQPSTINDQPN